MRMILIGGFGYAASVLTAVATTLIMLVLIDVNFWYDLEGTILLFCIGITITGICAFPGFMLAVIIQVIRDVDTPYYWVASGLIAAFIGNCIFGIFMIPFKYVLEATLLIASLSGGATGGYVYSLFHKRIGFLKRTGDAILVS